MAKKSAAVALAVPPIDTAIQQKILNIRKDLLATLIERDEDIDIMMTALLARQHPLYVGPPGTAKSLLADSLCRAIHGKIFSALLTKFSTMEEIFGPLDIQALAPTNGSPSRYRRVTAGYFPEADIAFFDEIFKGSSAILNTLLKGLNEGTFLNDGQWTRIPLLMAIAASNEWPGDSDQGKELGALFDRFLFRKIVRTIQTIPGRKKLLWTPSLTPQFQASITPAEIRQAQDEAAQIPYTQQAMDAMERIIKELQTEGIIPGDRRQRLSIGAARAYAYVCGDKQVDKEHLEILAHTLWSEPNEQPIKAGTIIRKIANPAGAEISRLLTEAQTLSSDVDYKDTPKVTLTIKKLDEIAGKLDGMKDSDKQRLALEYVRNTAKELKLAWAESMG